MDSYKRGSHTVWDCKYHLVWVTKYHYQVLGRNVTAEVWAEYIKNQTPPEPDDDFNVT